MERRKKRGLSPARYERMRNLLRVANRRRRHLRDKVDLLCKDLVSSNQQFTETLHELRRAYDFQSYLTGEFDLRYLLYKALRELKSNLPDAGAAIYLSDSGEFVAHLSGVWPQEGEDIIEWEQLFQETLVPVIMARKRAVLVSDGANWDAAGKKNRARLREVSLMGLPVIFNDEPIGVVIVYRRRGIPFRPEELSQRLPLLKPLAQAISSVRKLEGLVIQN